MLSSHHVVIVGGGFAGLSLARALKDAPVTITLLDRRNFHLFQPLLYQVATGGLSPADIASPLREILKRQRNTTVLLAEVANFDVEGRRVLFRGGEVPYDTLVVATGMENFHFGNEGWAELAPGLKTVEDATEIRKRILYAFEMAEREKDPAERQRWLSFAVIGGGPTGVELAGAIAELARDTLRKDFRIIHPQDAAITLLEGGERILPTFPEDLAEKARRALERHGVSVLTGTKVVQISEDEIEVSRQNLAETLRARTILWAAGVAASPLGRVLAEKTGARVDHQGRIVCELDLTLPGHSEIFVLGDLAHCAAADGKPLPGVAPVAMQEAWYAARAIKSRLRGRPVPPFRYRNRGNLSTVGRSFAVAQLGRFHLSGFLAWLLWVFVHILYLVGFENRVLVLTQWAWNYFTRNRSARLITWVDKGGPAG